MEHFLKIIICFIASMLALVVLRFLFDTKVFILKPVSRPLVLRAVCAVIAAIAVFVSILEFALFASKHYLNIPGYSSSRLGWVGMLLAFHLNNVLATALKKRKRRQKR